MIELDDDQFLATAIIRLGFDETEAWQEQGLTIIQARNGYSILTYICVYAPSSEMVELSSEGINRYHSHNAKLFEWIELSADVKRIYVNKTKVIYIYI